MSLRETEPVQSVEQRSVAPASQDALCAALSVVYEGERQALVRNDAAGIEALALQKLELVRALHAALVGAGARGRITLDRRGQAVLLSLRDANRAAMRLLRARQQPAAAMTGVLRPVSSPLYSAADRR